MKYLTLLLLACAAPLPAQTRLSSAIQFDGSPDELAWENVPALPFTTPDQRTVIKVAYDDVYFYAAGWFYDRRNRNDAFALCLDVVNDGHDPKWFGITPTGMRFETLLSEDGDKMTRRWETSWDAATTMTKEGWFVELRIPYSTMNARLRSNHAEGIDLWLKYDHGAAGHSFVQKYTLTFRS